MESGKAVLGTLSEIHQKYDPLLKHKFKCRILRNSTTNSRGMPLLIRDSIAQVTKFSSTYTYSSLQLTSARVPFGT